MPQCPMQTFYYHHPSTCHASFFFSPPPLLNWPTEEEEETRYCLYWLQSELRKSNLIVHSLDGYKEMEFHLRPAFLELLDSCGPFLGGGLEYIQQMTVLEWTFVNML